MPNARERMQHLEKEENRGNSMTRKLQVAHSLTSYSTQTYSSHIRGNGVYH